MGFERSRSPLGFFQASQTVSAFARSDTWVVILWQDESSYYGGPPPTPPGFPERVEADIPTLHATLQQIGTSKMGAINIEGLDGPFSPPDARNDINQSVDISPVVVILEPSDNPTGETQIGHFDTIRDGITPTRVVLITSDVDSGDLSPGYGELKTHIETTYPNATIEEVQIGQSPGDDERWIIDVSDELKTLAGIDA